MQYGRDRYNIILKLNAQATVSNYDEPPDSTSNLSPALVHGAPWRTDLGKVLN